MGSIASPDHTARYQSCDPDQCPSREVPIQYFYPDRPVKDNRKPPQTSGPRTGYEPFHRNHKSLYEESFQDITLHKGTRYPCTQKDLNATGGTHRRTALDLLSCKDPSKWLAHPNNGPFIDARLSAREVFDHNDLKRIPPAAEQDAIDRFCTALTNASREPWGPDLAIKAFCDLDKVFFCGRLRGHVCLTWKPARSLSRHDILGITHYVSKGKCVIQLNADTILLKPLFESSFGYMFSTLLHEMSHAYEEVRALDHGPTGWTAGRVDGHGKNFGTMTHAVNRRAWKLFGLQGDSRPYLLHDYVHDDIPAPTPPQPPLPADPPKSRRDLYTAALDPITPSSGSPYPCPPNSLDATGGLTRHHFPHNKPTDRHPSRNQWFPHRNHGPFTTPRRATLAIFQHNDPRRTPPAAEQAAIERLATAIAAARAGTWEPDLIVKMFCDLDTVFFRARLRGHVCVRWLGDWSAAGRTTWGTTVYLGKGKCAIKLNAESILVEDAEPFERTWNTMLHEMCHAYAHTQVEEAEFLKCASHGKNFGTMYHAVGKRARRLFGGMPDSRPEEKFPRFDYKKGEGLP